MLGQLSLFQKMVVSIVLLLIPVISLYAYSNFVSEQVVREEIESRNLNRLEVSMNRLEADLGQVSQFLVALSIDPETNRLRNVDLLRPYESVELQMGIQKKILLYQQLSNLLVDVSMFLPDGEKSITTMSASPQRPDELALSWKYVDEKHSKDNDRPYFVQHVQFPIQNERQTSGVIIEARIYVESMRKHLSELNSSDGGYAILYHHSFNSIKPRGAQHNDVNDLFHNGFDFPKEMKSIGTERFQDGDINYALTYIESPSLEWTLVDFVPVEKVLKPIATTRTWFYLSVSLLLCLGVAAAWLLYTQIHRPVDRIKDSILAFKKGNYGVRMEVLDQKEFAIAMNGFNDMAEQIQTLIEQVFEEKIRSQDATLKLLQAQIDPHFLYNCLFYIKNMAKVRNTDAVEAMALHLGDYFRYRTKVEQAETTITEELELVDNFLAIHALRKRHLKYSITVAEELNDCSIPRLLVQPIVENAVVHAIEEIVGIGIIRITGENKGGYCRISVEDNGGKLGSAEIEQMVEALEQEEVLTENYGMRNVHQRLRKRYGGRSGLRLSLSSLGGLQVDILWEEMNSNERRR